MPYSYFLLMNSGLASLHKILKDETRRKIIFLLSEKEPLSYTELMNELGFVSTGMLNYHLKILGDLLTKTEDGQYKLTEKGTLASRLLQEFPEGNSFKQKPKWERKFWKAAGTIAVASVLIHFAAFFLGYIELNRLLQGLLLIIPIISIIYLYEHVTRDILPEKIRSTYLRINYYARGVVIGFLLWFAMLFILNFTGLSRQIYYVMGKTDIAFAALLLIVCCFVGQAVNKWQVKRNNLLM